MELSGEFKELFAALSKAQGELENVHKSKTAKGDGKKFSGYSYADLGACIDVARPVLAKHGLAVSQGTVIDMSNGVPVQILKTMLMHESGQWMQSSYLLTFANNNDDQKKGSSITYARRYMYAAIIGLAQEDDEAKHRKEQEEAEARLDEVRLQFAENKKLQYQTGAKSPQALFDYHERAVRALQDSGKRGDIDKSEYKKRLQVLTEVYREVRDEKGFPDQAIANQPGDSSNDHTQ